MGWQWPPIEERIASLHYGDPPNVGCCPSGPSMNSVPREVLEVWTLERPDGVWPEWKRHPDLEGRDLTPDWASEEA